MAARTPPALADFHYLNDLGPRLHRGDWTQIIADSIFLQHAPDLTAGSKYQAFQKHDPVLVEIVGGSDVSAVRMSRNNLSQSFSAPITAS
jgi:hypothetical protein